VLSVREKEYIEAAISQGASNLRLMFSDILPNVISTAIVLLPLMIATTILTEAALSFLGIGVQAPQASWGTVIEDGQGLLYSRPQSGPGDYRCRQAPVRARPTAAGPVRADDEAHLHLARPRLLRQPGAEGRPGDPGRGAGDILARDRGLRPVGDRIDRARPAD